MNPIIIYPKNADRNDYADLVEHLKENGWSFEELENHRQYNEDDILIEKSGEEKLHSLVNRLRLAIGLAETLLQEIPSRGNKEEDCQKLCLSNSLRKFEQNITGLEESDISK